MSPRVSVLMLGRFAMAFESDALANGSTRRNLTLPATAKAQSLLAHLIIHRQTTHAREHLAELFWGDRPPHRARRSLSTALWRIRRCFAPYEVLESDHRWVKFEFPGEVWVDAEVFERRVKEAKGLEALQKAVDLYEGPFLPGLYDDWVMKQRHWLETLYQKALLQLMRGYEAGGDDQLTLRAALQALTHDPCCERAHRAAMRAYWRLGRRAAALEQYERCREALNREMNSAPSPETQALYEKLRGSTAARDAGLDLAPARPRQRPSRPSHPTTAEEPPLVGRDAELAFLLDRWREVATGQTAMLFLRGEAGIGKTRLLTTLARHVEARRGRVLAVECYEYEQAQPYGPLVDVLRAALAVSGKDIARQLSSWQIANLVRLAPELHDLLPSGAAYMATAEPEQRHVLGALTRLLLLVTKTAPALVLLDDLQWAHPSTLAWLPMLARSSATAPLLLMAAYRTEEVAPGDLLSRIIAQLEKEGRAQTLSLSRLAPQHLADWLRGLDAESIAQIHRHTEGNPFFVRETVRALLEQKLLHRVDGAYRARDVHFTLPLPDSVRQTIEMRLDALPPTARQGLAVGAVIGRIFDLDVWMKVWGMDEETELEALDELLRRRLLRAGDGPFARDYEFDHHLVQETVYQTILLRRRRQLHARTARILEKLRGDEPGASAQIALHYLRAGQPEQARPWLLMAGDQAVAVAATAEAMRFYQRALAAYPHDDAHRFERAVLERKMGEIHFRRGEYELAEQRLRHALALQQRPFPDAGLSLHWALSAALIRQIANRIRVPYRRTPSSITPALREEVAAYTSLGWMYSLQSRYEEYLLVSLRALNESEKAGYAPGIAVAATALGIAADFMARFGLAAYFHGRAQSAVAEVARPADAGFVAFGQAYHAYLCGDEETLLTQAALAAEKYRFAGDAHRWALSQVLQAYVFAHRGELKKLTHYASELSREGEALSDLEAQCAGASLAGLAARLRGEWEKAVAEYERAASLAAEMPDYMSLVENLAGLARCQVRLGRWSQARKTLTAAKEVVSEHDVRGDALGKYRIAAFEAALWATEHGTEAQAEWLARAKTTMNAARRQARAFRPAEPEVWRLCGRYEWLRGRPDAAQKWWERSLKRAEALNQRLHWAATALEMGLRLGDESLFEQGQKRLEDAGARGEIAFIIGA